MGWAWEEVALAEVWMKPAKFMMRLVSAVSLAASMALVGTVYSEENERTEAPQLHGADTDDNKKAESQSKQPRRDESFRPSEEISEDLSVPFPVDI